MRNTIAHITLNRSGSIHKQRSQVTRRRIIDASEPNPERLNNYVHSRLRELGLSILAASKMGYLSRSTLTNLAERPPSVTTLNKLDDLCSWEPGSARAVLYGSEPLARERGTRPRPAFDPGAADNFENLIHHIEARLTELNLTKSRFAEISGVGRSTTATLGQRGFTPTPETLDRYDTHLMWEPGSAAAALKGGIPIRRGPVPSPHPALIPITAIRERLQRLSARILRQRTSLDDAEHDIREMQAQIDLLYSDFNDPRRTMWGSSDQST